MLKYPQLFYYSKQIIRSPVISFLVALWHDQRATNEGVKKLKRQPFPALL